jgi:drug/metabolite transporter (DMT)-like permease
MTWQLLSIAYLVLGTATYLLQRKLGQSLPQHKRLVTGFFFIFIHYPMGLLVALSLSHNLDIGWLNMAFLLAGGWVFPIINLLTLKANKTVDAGLFTILSNIAPIITIVTAYFLLHEHLNHHQFVGAVIILASASLVTLPGLFNRRRSRLSTGILFALVAFLLTGFATVYETWMLSRIDLGTYLILGWGSQTLWTAIVTWPERKQLKVLRIKKNFAPILGYALANSLKGICFVAALKLSDSASLVTAFTSFMAVTVVVAAYFILRERDWLWIKIGAAIAGSIGLLILNGIWRAV